MTDAFADDNSNVVVDPADYAVYRETLGQSGPSLAADGNGNGAIDTGDYDVWRAHFGQTAGSGAGVAESLRSQIRRGEDSGLAVSERLPYVAVPEPASVVLLVYGLLIMRLTGGRRAVQRCHVIAIKTLRPNHVGLGS